MNQLSALLQELGHAPVLYEVGLALLCLGAAWSLTASAFMRHKPDAELTKREISSKVLDRAKP